MSNKKPILLIGNGPNLLESDSSNPSWQDVIDGLAKNSGYLGFKRGSKPFPIAFEEVLGKAALQSGITERKLKEDVATQVRKIRPNWLHKEIRNLPVTDILTTNYDYALSYKIANEQASSGSTERKYSLLRSYKDNENEMRIWHIHGEAKAPESIMLGHDQYVRYLGQIQNYLRPQSKKFPSAESWNASTAVSPVKFGIQEFDTKAPSPENVPRYSWVDLILTRPIHILGFGLDFSEIIIWWLLTVRSRKEQWAKYGLANPKNRAVTWWECGPDDKNELYIDRRQVAESLNIKTRFVKCSKKTYSDAYRKIVTELNEELSA
jgi:hypothetical protein